MDIYEKTKQRHEAMSFEEKKQDKINLTRQLRNIKLEKTDIYVSQNDRYNEDQINQLRIYRQQLRDLMKNENFDNLEKSIDFPIEPDFILQKELSVVSFLKYVNNI